MNNQAKNPLTLHSHLSFAWHRAVVSLLLIITGYIQFREYGAAFNQENDIGNWLFLGGPSLFYPTGAIGGIFAVLLALYVLGSLARITIMQSTNTSGASDLIIKEWRYGISHTTQILRSQIENLRLSNRTVGWHWLWILAFGAHILYLFTEVWYYAINPYTFGRGFDTMYYYLLQIGVEAICCWILVYRQSFQLRITTGDGVYFLNWSPLHAFVMVQTHLQAILNMNSAPSTQSDTQNLTQLRFIKVNLTVAERRRRLWMLGVGLLWVIIGGLCRFLRFGFGESLQYGLILCGFVLCYIQWINLKASIYEYTSQSSSRMQNKWESAVLIPLLPLLNIDIGLMVWACIHDLGLIPLFLLHLGLGFVILGLWFWVHRSYHPILK